MEPREEQPKARKKPGPVAGPPRERYNLLIDEELGEWGKRQPGGLSELVRRLLTEARAKDGAGKRGA